MFEPLTRLDQPVFDRFSEEGDGLLYSGIGSLLDPNNKFVFPIIRAESSTVSITNLEKSEEVPS